MKPLISVIFFLSAITLWGQEGGRLSIEEKSEISAHLQKSWENLERLVIGLTREQWNYKTVDSVWSIAEISEHLEKAEKELFSMVKDQLKKSPAEPEKVAEVNNKTKSVMDAITSRDHKVKTKPELEPMGYYDSPESFLKSFEEVRKQTMSYAQTTEDQLRHHFIPFGPLGDLDGYQILMFMSGHLERHIQQIEEVMEDPSYPSA
jgi:hypothetical protein